jgi:D-alanyl-D-alanine carboxypeptidase
LVLVGLLGVAGIAVALERGVLSGQQAPPSAPKDVESRVQALASGAIPGVLLFVRQADRSYTVTAGYADQTDKTPMRADDTFQIGSTTKTFTAVLVMRLVAQGRIALDATVETYLPGLLPDGDAITIRQLLSHSSGLSDFANEQRFLAPYEQGKLGYAWTPEQMVRFAAGRGLEFAPGTQFSYSNTNFIVLALLAERVGGERYERQLARFIFGPLELRHTSLPSTGRTRPDVHGYARVGATGLGAYGGDTAHAPVVDTAAMNPAAAWAAGGIRATAEDEADFLRGLFSGKLLPKAQVAAMKDTSASGGAYGLGLMPTGGSFPEWRRYTQAITAACGRGWGHGGSFPGYYQVAISSPDASRQAVLLVNTDEALLSPAQYRQFYDLLTTAYCRGVTS